MRTRRILVVLATVVTAGLLSTSHAQAGGWAETVLDPTPTKIESTVTYTFGFWVLQHGSYPYKGGDLGKVALTATDDDGNIVNFPATASISAGHYSAEVVFPHDSVWQLGVDHEMLAEDDNIALVTVPGGVEVSPSDVQQRASHDWGVVRPSFPPTAPGALVQAPRDIPQSESAQSESAQSESAQVAPRSHETAADDQEPGLPFGVVVAGALAVLGVAVWLVRRGRRSVG